MLNRAAIRPFDGGPKRMWWLVSLLALSLATRAAEAEPEQADWQRTRSEDGITSFVKARGAAPLPTFRAQTILQGNFWDAVAILDDVARACEWTSHCEEMRTVERRGDTELLVYAKMNAPWPVRDRDVVVRVKVIYGRDGELALAIRADPNAEPKSSADAVRMPRFEAHYLFRPLSGERALVEYQLDVDPGGTLPDWLKRLVARNLAHDTLADLRDRVRWARAQGLYAERSNWLEARSKRERSAEPTRAVAENRSAP